MSWKNPPPGIDDREPPSPEETTVQDVVLNTRLRLSIEPAEFRFDTLSTEDRAEVISQLGVNLTKIMFRRIRELTQRHEGGPADLVSTALAIAQNIVMSALPLAAINRSDQKPDDEEFRAITLSLIDDMRQHVVEFDFDASRKSFDAFQSDALTRAKAALVAAGLDIGDVEGIDIISVSDDGKGNGITIVGGVMRKK